MFEIVNIVAQNFHMYFVFCMIILSIIAYSCEYLVMENISISVIVVLILFFTIFPILDDNGKNILSYKILLRAFSNPALITVSSLLIIGHVVTISGALNLLGNLILRGTARFSVPNTGPIIAIICACCVSAFMNNTPVVLIFIPILAHITKEIQGSQSKVMIPLAYATSLGGMTTLLGNSTNLLIAEKVIDLGYSEISIFEFFYPGLLLCTVGLIYVIFIARYFLPDREVDTGSGIYNKEFCAEFVITESSKLCGKTMKEVSNLLGIEIDINMIKHDGITILQCCNGVILQLDDVVVMNITRDKLLKIIEYSDDYSVSSGYGEVHSVKKASMRGSMYITEVVVSPLSSFVGKVIQKVALFNLMNVFVLGVQSNFRNFSNRLYDKRLYGGDILLLFCSKESVANIHSEGDVLPLEGAMEDIHNYSLMWRVIGIFLLVVLMSAFGILPVAVSSLCGACLLLVTGCIDIEHFIAAIDRRVFFTICAAYMLSLCMEHSGGVDFIVDHILYYCGSLSPVAMMGVLFIVIMMLNEVLSNNAVGLLFAPIAIKIAEFANVDHRLFLWGIIFACSCAFITPIGYQTNLIVMSHGGYRFSDYAYVGFPLSMLMCITYLIFAYFYFT